jgi:phage terminase large subunit-like protein
VSFIGQAQSVQPCKQPSGVNRGICIHGAKLTPHGLVPQVVKNFKTKCTPPLANNCVLRIMRRRRYIKAERGRSSGVERNLAKVEVVSSNLIARSNSLIKKQLVTRLSDSAECRHVSEQTVNRWFDRCQIGANNFNCSHRVLKYPAFRRADISKSRVIWLDEEPPADIYDECLMRTTTTTGIMMLTFTPLDGLSDVTEMCMPSNAGI